MFMKKCRNFNICGHPGCCCYTYYKGEKSISAKHTKTFTCLPWVWAQWSLVRKFANVDANHWLMYVVFRSSWISDLLLTWILWNSWTHFQQSNRLKQNVSNECFARFGASLYTYQSITSEISGPAAWQKITWWNRMKRKRWVNMTKYYRTLTS
jgi:hypothetical protein